MRLSEAATAAARIELRVSGARGAQGPTGGPGGNVMAVGLFADAGGLMVSDGTDLVQTSGYDAVGYGHAVYVADEAVDSAWVTAHPRAGFIAQDGRGFRLSGEQMWAVTMFGATQNDARSFTEAYNAAAALASLTGGGRIIIPDGNWLFDASLKTPANVAVNVAPGAIVKRRNETRVALVSGFTAGGAGGNKTFTVADASLFAVGQEVMFVDAAGANPSPNNSANHLNPVITAINAATDTITVSTASNLLAHSAGHYVQTASHGFILDDGARIELDGVIDGNYANQTSYYWISHNEVTVQGSRCRLSGNGKIINTPSDAILIASETAGSYIEVSQVSGITLEDIGANGIHYGLSRHNSVRDINIYGANRRITGINTAHQDGAIIMSNNCRDLDVSNVYVENALSGVGSIDGDALIENDQVTISNLRTKNVRHPLEVTQYGRRVIWNGGRCVADVALVGGETMFGDRWDANQIYLAGSSEAARVSDVSIRDIEIVNGNVFALHTINVTVDVSVDNSGMMNPTQAANQDCISFASSSSLQVRGRVIGNRVGVRVTNAFASSDTVNRPSMVSVQCVDQVFGGITTSINTAATQVTVTLQGSSVTNATATANGGFVAYTLGADTFAVGNRAEISVGTVWGGATANRAMNVVNGVMESVSSVTGGLTIYGPATGSGLELKAGGGGDLVYMALFGDIDNPLTRTGYFGVAAAGAPDWTWMGETGLLKLGGSSTLSVNVTSDGLDLYAGKTLKVTGIQVVGGPGAAVADPAAITSSDAANSAAAPTKAEFDALVAKFNQLRADFISVRTTQISTLARLRAGTGHGLFVA